jgi:hypothetical protein
MHRKFQYGSLSLEVMKSFSMITTNEIATASNITALYALMATDSKAT